MKVQGSIYVSIVTAHSKQSTLRLPEIARSVSILTDALTLTPHPPTLWPVQWVQSVDPTTLVSVRVTLRLSLI